MSVQCSPLAAAHAAGAYADSQKISQFGEALAPQPETGQSILWPVGVGGVRRSFRRKTRAFQTGPGCGQLRGGRVTPPDLEVVDRRPAGPSRFP
jgi:hypothetical protein